MNKPLHKSTRRVLTIFFKQTNNNKTKCIQTKIILKKLHNDIKIMYKNFTKRLKDKMDMNDHIICQV